ncbi:MAG: acyl carrier protein [Parcubacteria group bacterium]|jgi:acyl carrier protein
MSNIEKQVIDIIVDQLSVKREEVVPTAHFTDDLGADSLDLVELLQAFEEKLDVEIPDDDAGKINTVQDAIDYFIKNK